MATFSSINAPQGGGTPAFTQETPVSDGVASTVGQVATLGSSVFNSAIKASNASKATAEDTALGALKQQLIKIRRTGETSDIDVVRESRKAMSKFNSDYPSLRNVGNKAFKEVTGVGPAQASAEEIAEQKLSAEAIASGHGRYGAPDAYNAEQQEIFVQTRRANLQNAASIQQIALMKARGEMSKELAKTNIIASVREMSGLSYKKYASDSKQWIADAASGDDNAIEGAKLDIRRARIDISRALESLGEYATDDAVTAYMAPIFAEIQLAEDVITGKIEIEAIQAEVAINKARAQGVLYSDPDMVNAAVLSESFGYTIGLTSKMTAPAYAFLNNGLVKEDMVGGKSKSRLPDPTSLEEDGKKGVAGTVENMVNHGDDKAHKEVATTLTGVAEHLNRNGMDYEAEDKKFVIDLLSTPKAMELLSPQQKDVVFSALEMYIVDDVKVAADRYIVNPPPVTVSFPFPRSMGGGKPESKQLSEVADFAVVEGRAYWTIKPKYATNPKVQQTVRNTNKKIAEDVTPTLSLLSKGAGQSFEVLTDRIVFGKNPDDEVKEEPAKK
jgi:hypothetical protein